MTTEVLRQNKENIIDLYDNGLTQQDIANLYNTSKSSVARFLRSVGITSKVVITDEDEQKIIDLHNNGVGIRDIAKHIGIGKERISKVLHKYNVTMKPHRKYSLYEDYFDNIDDQDKAYILGLFYADGSNNNGHITISLQERDKDILEQINLKVGSNRPIKFIDYSSKNPNHQNQYLLTISSKYMCNALANSGMIHNKSLLLTFPNWLNKELYPHLIRGYFDGDGYVSKNIKNAKLSIIGTESFCKSIKNIIKEEIDVNCGIYLCHNNTETTTRMLQISGRRQISKFLNYIYKDANLFIDRKYNIYKSLYSEY